jgi:SAM-dependent MidA family methyltransferase
MSLNKRIFVYETILNVLHIYERKPSEKLFGFQADERRDHVEVCAEGGVILQHLATRLEEDGGFALFADYGHDGSKTDTFRVRFTFCNNFFP